MFKDILKQLNLENNNNLLFVTQKDAEINETQRKYLYLAHNDYLADAVFFQKNSNEKYIPQFFIYDNTNNEKFNNVSLSEIHKRLWSSKIVPLYFIIEKNAINIYNTKQKINILKDKNNNEKEEINPTDILKITKKLEIELKENKNFYAPLLFQNGSFWETEYYLKKYLNNRITKESPFDILISNLHELKEYLNKNIETELLEQDSNDLTKLLSEDTKLNNNGKKISIEQFIHKTTNRIVVFSILIKYLEEKKDKNGDSVFTIKGNLFQNKWNVKDYSELIKENKFYELLNYLSARFNGKIFELTKAEQFLIQNLPKNSLSHLSNFVNANYKNKNTQLYLWRLYSFQYLPVELISRIYEEFIPDTAGVVYTPPFLVDLLIDECMPLDDYKKFNTGKFKIIDPACGSGIFCVSVYQRLIDWHIINEYKLTKKWNKDLKIETLKKILSENIFGVDKQQEAVNIAVFSLTLALLEKLTPKQLWEDLDFEDSKKTVNKSKKLKNLKEENIVYDDFFNYLQRADKDFDLVIGNPPFNPDGMENSEYVEYLESNYHLETSFKIPENNLALLFLDTSINLLKKNGLQCLILPSGNILYNARSIKYRNYFFENYTVPQIIDFTHLRETLFKSGKKKNKGRVATCAFFAKKQKPNKDNEILHLISHRTTNEENKMFFVFDTYDFHFVPLNIALTQKYIWKSNLVGGGRLNWIADWLSREQNTLDKFIRKSKDIKYLTGRHKINSSEITKNKIITIKRLIREGSIQIDLLDLNNVNNKSEINFKYDIGIQIKSSNIFKHFYNTIKSNKKLYSFFIALNSVEYLFERETSYNKIDFKNLPYPQTEEDKQDIQLSEIEQIWQEDVFNYYIHQGKASKDRKGEINPLLQKANIEMVQKYAEIFNWLMNLNYTLVKEKSFKTQKITLTNSFIAVEFCYCKENIKTKIEEKTEQEYQNYFETQIGRNKKIERIVDFIDFANNKIYYIKPLQKRYWLKSIADRDAMKCFADFGNNKFNERR